MALSFKDTQIKVSQHMNIGLLQVKYLLGGLENQTGCENYIV